MDAAVNNPVFKPHHFPRGTVCEISSTGNRGRGPRVVTVESLRQTCGYGLSVILVTKEDDDLTDKFGCNIDHVTRIIRRGPGVAVLEKSAEASAQYHAKRVAQLRDIFVCTKPKSSYLTFDTLLLVAAVGDRLICDDMTVDYDRLEQMVRARGLFKQIQPSGGGSIDLVGETANKKKLRRAVKQMLNKCLKSAKQIDSEARELEERDRMRERSYDD